MRLNKDHQYAILLALYLSRSGKARISDIALNLNLSESLLQHISRKLRLSGIVKAFKGPHGGVALVGDPTVKQVFAAIAPFALISNELSLLGSSSVENRTLLRISSQMTAALNASLKLKLSEVGAQTVKSELNQLDNFTSTTISS